MVVPTVPVGGTGTGAGMFAVRPPPPGTNTIHFPPFAPVIEANGGGAVLNVLSVLSWVHIAPHEAYAAAKAASWAMTNALRSRLAPKGIRTTALHVGYMETDLVADIDSPKSDPAVVAALALDGVQAGAHEVLADDLSTNVRAGLSADLTALYPHLTASQA